MARNLVERAIETETDTKNRGEQARLVHITGYKPPRAGEPTGTANRANNIKCLCQTVSRIVLRSFSFSSIGRGKNRSRPAGLGLIITQTHHFDILVTIMVTAVESSPPPFLGSGTAKIKGH